MFSKLFSRRDSAEPAAAVAEVALSPPGDTDQALARADELFSLRRYWEALWVLENLQSRGVGHATLPLRIGRTHLALGNFRDAENWMRKALAASPDSTDARDGVISALVEQGEAAAAIAEWKTLYGPDDRDPRRLTWMVSCLAQKGDFADAEAAARRLLAIEPNQPGVWINLGIALEGQGQREQALGAFEEATRIDDRLGSGLDAFVNVGKQLAMLGRLDAALKLLEARLPAQPNIEGHFIYGETLLKAGRFHEGWRHYEFRWMRGVQVFLRHKSGHPIWNGQDLRGKTILVLKEQGMGDTIQFVRYLPMLKQRGATVLLQKVPGFDRSFAGVDRIVELEDSLEFDYYISLLSLAARVWHRHRQHSAKRSLPSRQC